MYFFERVVSGKPYRIVAESVWDPEAQRSVARQLVLGPADPSCVAELADTEKVGEMSLGDTGALAWVAEQIDAVGIINRACAGVCPAGEVSWVQTPLCIGVDPRDMLIRKHEWMDKAFFVMDNAVVQDAASTTRKPDAHYLRSSRKSPTPDAAACRARRSSVGADGDRGRGRAVDGRA